MQLTRGASVASGLGRATLWCVLMCFGRIAHAAEAPAPSLGTRVRITLAGESRRLVGTLTSVDGQSLSVQSQGREPTVVAREAILLLERSTKPSRRSKGAVIGFGIGLSASAGKVAMQGGCNDGCNGGNLIVGGLVAATTAAVGALVSSGEHWEDVSATRKAWQPRETRPRLHLAPSLGRGMGLSVVATF